MQFFDENLDFEPIRIERSGNNLESRPRKERPHVLARNQSTWVLILVIQWLTGGMIPRPLISDDDNEWKRNQESKISARGTVFKKGYSILFGCEKGFRVLTPGHIRQCCKSWVRIWLIPYDWRFQLTMHPPMLSATIAPHVPLWLLALGQNPPVELGFLMVGTDLSD